MQFVFGKVTTTKNIKVSEGKIERKMCQVDDIYFNTFNRQLAYKL